MRLRIQFEKLGPARFSSHKDLVRMFQRCFAAAGIPVAYSEGFHPHMKMSFGPPLRTGWESDAEFLDLVVERPPGLLADVCNAHLPEGMRIVHVAIVPERIPKLASDIGAATYEVTVRSEDCALVRETTPRAEGDPVAELSRRVTSMATNGTSGDTPRVLEARAEHRGDHVGIVYTTTMNSGKVVVPDDLVAATIGDPATFTTPPRVRRTAQFVRRGGEYVSPISRGVVRNTP
jgi:radical SAM-linked protein